MQGIPVEFFSEAVSSQGTSVAERREIWRLLLITVLLLVIAEVYLCYTIGK